ncbi:hypothetical protein [Corynebacterium alimapuense]|uniref:Glycerophosphoryl diester phosphodiesterase membrane domain-containing protein n=1 Tax=Corynebacterium alimapuense TaxID=1576874 RepID=A0A3M8K7W1_9CORY|nr:hypothetical protein [Corynebacterium alimapuense]RNE49321.1 hypothetical protein C5L39_02845 [Corynebacterium alimapuense]
MTQPGVGPEDDRSRDDETPGDFPNYPAYPSTPHPEDSASYGASESTPSSYPGYQHYNVDGANWAATSGGYAAGQQPQGTGKVQIREALGWAFKTTFRNWALWIFGLLALMAAGIVVSVAFDLLTGAFTSGGSVETGWGYQLGQLLLTVIFAGVMIAVYHGALRQIDQAKVGLNDFVDRVNFWPSLGMSLLVQIVSGVVAVIFVLPLVIPMLGVDVLNITDAEAMDLLGQIFLALAVVLLISALISPLVTFIVWYLVDRKTGFWEAISQGVRNGLANYAKLLLFFVLAMIVSMIAMVMTFGLALIILMPVGILTQAMLYRQMSSGPLPAQETATY